MAHLNPYLNFKGNAHEVMTFYKDVLGGSLEIMTFGDSPMGAQTPESEKNKVMHSVLMKDGQMILMGADMMGDAEPEMGNMVTLCLICKTEEEINTLFAKLSAGGKVTAPLKKEFFGWFGQFTDKYGMNWMMQQGEDMKK